MKQKKFLYCKGVKLRQESSICNLILAPQLHRVSCRGGKGSTFVFWVFGKGEDQTWLIFI